MPRRSPMSRLPKPGGRETPKILGKSRRWYLLLAGAALVIAARPALAFSAGTGQASTGQARTEQTADKPPSR
jgi:hypothetical protein